MIVRALGYGAALRRPDAFTVLHIRGDNPPLADGFNDETGKAITSQGNAIMSTTGRFIGGSWYGNATGDYLATPDSDDFNFGSGDLTWEAWVNIETLPAVSSHAYLASQYESGSYLIYWRLRRNTTTQSCRLYVDVVWLNNAVETDVFTTTYFTAVAGEWFHVATTRASGVWRSFVNGVQVGNNVTQAAACPNVAAEQRIIKYASMATTLRGFIDEIRFTKGLARYTANFTPPTRRM